MQYLIRSYYRSDNMEQQQAKKHYPKPRTPEEFSEPVLVDNSELIKDTAKVITRITTVLEVEQ